MATPGPAIFLNDIFIPTLTGYSYNDGTSGYIQLGRASLQLTSTTAQEDSAKEMWTTYLEEVKVHDEGRANSWTEDASSTIIFVSLIPTIPLFLAMTSRKANLFSAIVAGFIIESYKKLSPDTGDQTILLLGQISQQLA